MLNNKVFNSANIRAMHETMTRLYEAARLLHGVTTPTELARLLNVSPQAVNNWERRGISAAGLLDAQDKIGCSATWVMTGQPPMLLESNPPAVEVNSPNSEQKLGEIADSASADTRTMASGNDASTMTSSQRLRAALHDKGLTSSEIASVAGVGIDAASKWMEGEGPEITLAQAVSIQNTYGVNAVWLTKGKGDPGITVRFTDEFRPIPITKWRAIPVVGRAQLGDNGHWADLEFPVGHGDGYIDFPTQDPNAYALKCEGDSMRPRIKAGEFVVIEPNQPIEPGDEVLVKSKDGRVMVKEFLYKRAGRTHLISANDAHKPIALADDEIEKIHFVRAICRPSSWRPE
ncbi:S24 family peptidase [Burkholderia sp. 8Y]|uniref:S24 family peptidase n=1 Tax=Burkholderia sp. 8Y TaxID=2653133 RepID=UPI001F2B775E|nr:S24 family peptidase [Burkholderia sp. 8Y]